MKILVIRSSAMGDVAMTAPVLAEVARRHPNVEIVMLTRGFYEPFFDGIPNFTIHNIDLSLYHRGVVGLWRLYRELRTTHRIDLIIDLNDKIYSKLLRAFYNLRGVTSFHIDKGRDEKKALTQSKNKIKVPLRTSIQRYADVFCKAGLDVFIEHTLKPDRRALSDSMSEYLPMPKQGKWIGIAPFAQHRGKVYPLEKMREVVGMLLTNNPDVEIFIFGGGALEQALADEFADLYPRCRSVIGMFTLRQEIDLISNLDLLISMDSSSMHMASLVGIRVISIWGATHSYAGFLGLGQSMEDTIGADIYCRPCSVYGHKECYRGDYACMNEMSPEFVYDKIAKVLKQI